MVPPSDQRLVFSSLIAYDHMSAKKSFALAESTMKPYMEIAAREIHGGTIGCNLSAKTTITDITGADNFSEKLADNFSEYGVTWLKCKTESIGGARAMVDIRNGTVTLIKQVAPEIASIQNVAKHWRTRS